MARLTNSDRERLSGFALHWDGCQLTPIECLTCIEAKGEVMNNVGYLLADLDANEADRKDLVDKLGRADLRGNALDDNVSELEGEVADLGRDLEETRICEEDTRSLVTWALEAGAEVPDLRASSMTLEIARVVQLERGGPACSSYQPTGKLDLCRCGRALREHRREVVGA